MATSFLRPVSANVPNQGAFQFRPQVFLHEAESAAQLEADMAAGVSAQEGDPTNYWIVESVQFQVTHAPVPGNMDRVLYTALLHATQVEKI